MTENVTPEAGIPPSASTNTPDTSRPGLTSGGRGNRTQNRPSTQQSSTSRDFEGATPKIGGILGLRSENVSKKVNYDAFCEKLAIYVMNELKDGDAIVEVTRNPSADIIAHFEANNKPTELVGTVSSSEFHSRQYI